MKIPYFFLAALFLMLRSLPAFGWLGGNADSIEADRRLLSGTTTLIPTTRHYSLYEINSDSTQVRQYVAKGKVFAITWAGGRHADLKQVLGEKWEEYKQALNASRKNFGSRTSRTQTKDLIVEHWGHQRKLQGRAYLPAALPNGVEVHALD